VPYYGIKTEAEQVSYPKIFNDIQEIEFDEMWHFVVHKKTTSLS